jgi:hypothetical protein
MEGRRDPKHINKGQTETKELNARMDGQTIVEISRSRDNPIKNLSTHNVSRRNK